MITKEELCTALKVTPSMVCEQVINGQKFFSLCMKINMNLNINPSVLAEGNVPSAVGQSNDLVYTYDFTIKDSDFNTPEEAKELVISRIRHIMDYFGKMFMDTNLSEGLSGRYMEMIQPTK